MRSLCLTFDANRFQKFTMKKIATTLFFLIFSLLQPHAQALYDPNQITLIEITFKESNWDTLLNNYYAAGSDQRLLATVEINGESFDSVGVRYRGGSTYDPTNEKNPLNIKLDHLKAQNYQGFEVLKLSNGAKDPSWLREVLSFEVARKYMEAPLANYSSVYVNGSFHGLYANVESINSRFVTTRFLSNPDNTRFECSPDYAFDKTPTVAPVGCALGHGSSLEFLGNGINCYAEHYEMQSATGWNELVALTSLLKNNPQNIRQLLDLDRFIWMCALNSLLVNLDSYLGASPRNYFILKTDNGHFVPVIDDMNESFARFPWTAVPQSGDPQPPLVFYQNLDPYFGNGNDQKPLLNAIFSNPTWKRMYTAHLRTLIAENITNGWLEQRASALQNLIGFEVQMDAKSFYTYDDFLKNLHLTVIDPYNGEDAYGLLPLAEGRASYLSGLPELQALPPAISGIDSKPSQPTPGTSVTITAQVTNANANSVWLGHRNNLKEVFTLTQMFDDGAHGDGAANDGTFGASVTVGAGSLQYYIYAENTQAGSFSPQRAEFEFHQLGVTGNVVINELMATNQITVTDPNGQYEDWVELYNNTSGTINLSGWYLSDNSQSLTKWQFPNGTFIDPGGYLTIWLDGDLTQAGLHASFSLFAEGEEMLLVTPSLGISDRVVFGQQTTDVSLGRCPDGVGVFVKMPPTFGSSNAPACTTNTNDRGDLPVLHVYPNPANGWITIETESPMSMPLRMADMYGRTVRTATLETHVQIPVQSLPPGMYFLEIGGRVVKRVMVAR
jgi:hypothetical protein